MKALKNTHLAAAVFSMLAGVSLQANAGEVTEVSASDLSDTQHVTVSYDDLDLSSARGQEVLYYRIVRAADQVCGSSELRRAGSVAQATRNRACFRDSLSRALAAVPTTVVASLD